MQHVIIAGFGPVGRVLADALIENGVPFTVVETNATTVSGQRSLGRSIVHGDATDPEALKAAGIADASAVVITIPDPQKATRICRLARSLAPSALIAIRTRHLSEALQAKQLGVDITVVEEIETAKAMATVVTAALDPGDQSSRACADDGAELESGVRFTKVHSRPARRCNAQQRHSGRHSTIPNHDGSIPMRNGRTKPRLIITETDHTRLRELIMRHRMAATESPWALLVLEQQLDNAQIVPSREVPDNVVTMRSKVRVRTEDEQEPAEYTIEYPQDADSDRDNISILTPLASAVLGERSGEEVAWNLAAGVVRYQVGPILYQPEAAGHFDQ